MSTAVEEVEEPVELKALSTNITYISDTVTVGNSLQWFSNCLVEKRLISHRNAREILDSGAAPNVKAGQLIDCVRVRLQNAQPEGRRALYDSFVAVFSREEAYTDLVERLKHSVNNDCGAPNLGNLALSPPIAATPGADFSQQHHLGESLSLNPFAEITSPPWTLTKVKERIQFLERTFSDMHADTVTELSKREDKEENFLERFRSHLLLLPVRKSILHVKFFNQNEDDIVAALSTRNVLAILCRYVDYRNYQIFQFVVLSFASAELQEKMQRYCELLEEFETATTVEVYIQAIPNIEVDEELLNGFNKMVVKVNKPPSDCRLLDIRRLNKAIIKKSSLCSHSVYIGAVSSNCVSVELRFPSSAVGWVLAAMTPDFLKEQKLSEVAVDGRKLSRSHIEKDKLSDELLLATEKDDVVAVASLLNSSDIQSDDEILSKALYSTCLHGNLQNIRFLISRGANVNYKDEDDWTPLMSSVHAGYDIILKELVLLGADVDATNSEGNSAVMEASIHGKIEVVVELINSGADLKLQNENGDTALILATSRGNAEMVSQLVRAGASLDVQNKNGVSAIIEAAYWGFIDIKMLMIAKANLDLQDETGNTALMVAARRGHTEVVMTLMKSGADLHIKNEDGDSALTLAARGDHSKVVMKLVKALENTDQNQ